MKTMKIVAVLLVLGGISFGASYFVATKFGAPASPAAASAKEAASRPAPEAAAPAEDLIPLTVKDQQLDSLAKELRRRLEECKKRQEELDQREQRVQLAQEMLNKRAQELETMQVQLVAPLASLKEAQAELLKNQVMVSQQEKGNLKRTAAIYEKMDPARAGRILMDMCGGTQEDDAARILHFMNERAAAKLLAEISDKGLAARLCDRLKRIKEES